MSRATAAVCRRHGQPLEIETVEVAPPEADEIAIDIGVVSICHSDISYAAGDWGGPTPAIYGHEAAGVISAAGQGVSDLAPGQRVAVSLIRFCSRCYHCLRAEDYLCVGDFPDETPFRGMDNEPIVRGLRTGAFSSRTVVHRSQVVPIPDALPLEVAAMLGCSVLTGFGAVTNTARVPAGATVTVVGAGGVGINAIQAARWSGASQVFAVDPAIHKLDQSRTFGATETVDPLNDDPVAWVRSLTDGIGSDFVFVTVGVAGVVEQAMRMARRGGTVVVVGMPPTGVMTGFETAEFADASLRIVGSKMGSSRLSADIGKLVGLYLAGDLLLDQMISGIYPLEKINDAIADASRAIRNLVTFTA